MALPFWKQRQLDKDYEQWLYKRRGEGLGPKPLGPIHTDPYRYHVPLFPESQRRRLGKPSQLGRELVQLQIAREAGRSVDPIRATELAKEVHRLRTQKVDIAWAQAAREADEAFVRESYKWGGAAATQAEVGAMAKGGLPAAEAYGARPSKGFRRFLTKKNAMIAAGAAIAAWMIWPKADDNTIEAMAHGGWAGDVRRGLTDFGSGYRGPNPQINPAYNLAQEVPRYEMMRASQIGKSEAELYKYFTRDEEPSEYLAASASAGTALHMLEEAKRVASGEMGGAEELLWDPLMRISGHTDISLAAGQPVDIKTVSQRRFEHVQRGGAFQRHISQLNWYMHMKNAEKGYLEYISREDTSQRQLVEVEYSEARLQKDLAKLEKVRQRVKDDIESGRLVKEALPKTASIQTLRRAEAEREELGDIAEMERIFEEEMRYLNRVKQEHFAHQVLRGGRRAANTIPGLHPGSEGMGAQSIRAHSEFGSGWLGGLKRLFKPSGGLLSGRTSRFSANEVISLSGLAKEKTAEEFAMHLGVKTNLPKFVGKLMGGGATLGSKEVFRESLSLVSSSWGRAKARAGEAMIRAAGLRRNTAAIDLKGMRRSGEFSEDEIKRIVFHEASELLSLRAATPSKDLAAFLKAKGHHRAAVEQEELFVRHLGNKELYAETQAMRKLEGLHPGSEGIGAQSMQAHSEFGSGWTGGLVAAIEGKADVSPAAAVASYLLGGRRKSTIDGIHPGSEGMGAQSIRAHSDFGTGFDPMRRIAQGLFPSLKPSAALKTLFGLPAVRKATQAALKTEGKALGKGYMAEIRGYTTEFVHKGRTYPLEFATKRELPVEEMMRNLGVKQGNREWMEKYSKEALRAESVALKELGELQTPSFYGMADESTILMEQLQGVKELGTGRLTQVEAESLGSFMKTAHSRGFTHTDLHGGNIVRVMSGEGKREVVALDWGTVNRFAESRGVGGQTAGVWDVSSKIINEEAQKALGTTVTMKQYAEMADLKRIQAHTMQKPFSFHHLGVNAPVRYHEKTQAAVAAGTGPHAAEAAKELKQSEFMLRKAAGAVFGRAAQTSYRGAAGAERTVALAESVAATPRAIRAKAAPLKNPVAQTPAKEKLDLGFADTMLQQTPSARPSVAKVVSSTDKTRILKRNKKFYERSKTAVGVGLRSAYGAGKKHSEYSSTKPGGFGIAAVGIPAALIGTAIVGSSRIRRTPGR